MNVAISACWEKFVDELVRSGRYASPAEEGTLTDDRVSSELRAHLEGRRAQGGKCAS